MSNNKTLRYNFSDDGMVLTELTPGKEAHKGAAVSMTIPFAAFAELVDQITKERKTPIIFKTSNRGMIIYKDLE